jgi:hypothetical protein
MGHAICPGDSPALIALLVLALPMLPLFGRAPACAGREVWTAPAAIMPTAE